MNPLLPLLDAARPDGPWYRLVDRPGNALANALSPARPQAPEVVSQGPAGRLLAHRGERVALDPRAGAIRRDGVRVAESGDRLHGLAPARSDWLRRVGVRRRTVRALVRLAYGPRLDLAVLAFDLLPRLAVAEAAEAGAERPLPLAVSLAVGGSDPFQDLMVAGFFLPRAVVVQWVDQILLTGVAMIPEPAPDVAGSTAFGALLERLRRSFPPPPDEQPARGVLLVDRRVRPVRDRGALAAEAAALGLGLIDAETTPLRRLVPAIAAAEILAGHDGLAMAAARLRPTAPSVMVDLSAADGSLRRTAAGWQVAPGALTAKAGARPAP